MENFSGEKEGTEAMVLKTSTHYSARKVFYLFLIPLIVGVGIFLLSTQPASASLEEGYNAQIPDNAKCLLCHDQPDQYMELQNGDMVSITIDPEHYGNGMHSSVSCQVCHTNISEYPHPANEAVSAREYTLQYQGTCERCHATQADELKDSAHTKLFEAGNLNAPICVDCHNPHTDTPFLKNADGTLATSEHARIANTCAKCHNGIFEEYATSVHGSGVFVEKNPDVPSCTDCHGVHTISGPRGEPTFRLSSPNICAKCHTDKALMDKYGLSTQVMNTYVADFHGTTVTIFEKTDPDQETNMPVCFDCHGIHNIKRTDDPEKGLQVKENLLVTCQRCHPDANTNFPDAWLSHYIPTPNRWALVYYVDLVYKILIPAVLGAMALFILTDLYRKTFRKHKHTPGGGPSTAKDQESGSSQANNSSIG